MFSKKLFISVRRLSQMIRSYIDSHKLQRKLFIYTLIHGPLRQMWGKKTILKNKSLQDRIGIQDRIGVSKFVYIFYTFDHFCLVWMQLTIFVGNNISISHECYLSPNLKSVSIQFHLRPIPFSGMKVHLLCALAWSSLSSLSQRLISRDTQADLGRGRPGQCLRWHPIPYIVQYFGQKQSTIYGNRVPFGGQPRTMLAGASCLPIPLSLSVWTLAAWLGDWHKAEGMAAACLPVGLDQLLHPSPLISWRQDNWPQSDDILHRVGAWLSLATSRILRDVSAAHTAHDLALRQIAQSHCHSLLF